MTAGPPPRSAVRVNGGEPQAGLVPSNTNEGYGNRIVDLLFAGLYDYTCDGTARPVMLERVDSADNREFRFTLRPGWTFTDGSPVHAGNFVAAWNYAAAGRNAQRQQSWFGQIEGFRDVADAGSACAGMSGLIVEDDRSFTVRLAEPNRDFLNGLGCTAFKPLPERFFGIGERRFGEQPVGNGPYRLAGWQHGTQLELVPNPDYPGPDPADNDGITFVFYRDLESAYQDLLAGDLDVLDCIPDSALDRYRDELGARAVELPVALNKSIGVPYRLDRFAGEEGRLRRAAISMAIDRPAIIDRLFAGS
ncbi:MAG TPA: ABC transporter substrate-binding protein, partial [Jatrophihabitans sp.]|nr:ABC transporter substrate-binding protein [Jatrophihabitans sp.]